MLTRDPTLPLVPGGGDYLGSLADRDRVVGYDMLGSTLAVLVERPEPDSVGLYPRHVDWYRITEAS